VTIDVDQYPSAPYEGVHFFRDNPFFHWNRKKNTPKVDLVHLSVGPFIYRKVHFTSLSVASPEFVARRCKAGNYVMGHSRWTSGPGPAAAQWL